MWPVAAVVVSVGHHQNPDADRTLERLVVGGSRHQDATEVPGSRTVLSGRWCCPVDRLGKCVPDREAWAVSAAEVVDGGDQVEEPVTALVERLRSMSAADRLLLEIELRQATIEGA